jgi:hypothetical protein
MTWNPALIERPQPFTMCEPSETGSWNLGTGYPQQQPAYLGGGDNVSPMLPPWAQQPGQSTSTLPNPFASAIDPIGSIMQLLQQIMGMLQGAAGNGLNGCNGWNGTGGGEQYFQSANGGSAGDPHLSFNGTTWDNMGSQPDLLRSDSMPGGFRISTQATAPAANGVTYNQSATVTMNNGNTHVSLDNAGNATIAQGGYSYPLAAGQTISLGNGEIASRAADGSLCVTCNNGNGGAITTTMSENGNGVDVSVSANNVDLGGALVNGGPGAVETMSRPQGYA